MKFATRCVHAGQAPDDATGAVAPPIHQSTTYAQSEPGVHKGWSYSRGGNPTRDRLEHNLAALEDAPGAAAFSSGMAAISALLHTLPQPAHVVCGASIYGGTHRMFTQVYEPMGMRFTYVDTSDLAALEAALTPDTAMLFLETPSNPLMHIVDIQAACGLAHAVGAKVAVDNTFMSPRYQRPLELGADFSVHSGTKYLGGHSDVVIGFVLPSCHEDLEPLRFLQKAMGAVPSPMESWLCMRGLKTLAVRMDAHCRGAAAAAQALRTHEKVRRVYYPGLPEHPGYEVQMRQSSEVGGGMLSFELEDIAAVRRFCRELTVFTLAESLGAVESLVSVPALMTHASLSHEVRVGMGIHDGLVRLSVGIEDPEDLVLELLAALDAA